MSTLTTTQKQQVAEALATRKSALCSEIQEELKRSGHEQFADLAGEVTDAGDASVADMLVDKNIATIARQVEELTQVEAAQKRIADEDFGDCVECGAEIGINRLVAVPQATRCIACQGQHEKMFAHEATPNL
jgi:RNA polymerase-binding protein DksA